MVGMTPIASGPARSPARSLAMRISWCASSNTRRAAASTASPSGVAVAPWRPRSNTTRPMRCSASATCDDSAGWLTWSASEAAPNVPCSATATRYSSCRTSTSRAFRFSHDRYAVRRLPSEPTRPANLNVSGGASGSSSRWTMVRRWVLRVSAT